MSDKKEINLEQAEAVNGGGLLGLIVDPDANVPNHAPDAAPDTTDGILPKFP